MIGLEEFYREGLEVLMPNGNNVKADLPNCKGAYMRARL
jgi:hypothetical protein